MALEKDDIKQIKEILDDSLKEAGVTEAMEKMNESQLTKEEILAVKNTAKRQQLIRENIDLFK